MTIPPKRDPCTAFRVVLPLGNNRSVRISSSWIKLWRNRERVQVAHTLERLSGSTGTFSFTRKDTTSRGSAENLRNGWVTGQGSVVPKGPRFLLHNSGKYDAAEEAVSRAMDLFLKQGEQYPLCECHVFLETYIGQRPERESHRPFPGSPRYCWSFRLARRAIWNYHGLAWLFLSEARFDDAQSHIQRARPHAIETSTILLMWRTFRLNL